MQTMARKKVQRSEADTVRITEPKAIRALAHSARIAMIDALYAGEQLTATEFAAMTGLTASAASYHLRALERWGFVRRADASGDGRERPWAAAGKYLEIDSLSADPGPLTGSIQALLDRDRSLIATFMAGRAKEPEEWRDELAFVSAKVWLTPDELAEVVASLRDSLEGFRDRTKDGPRPAGSRPVRVSLAAIPLEQPAQPTGSATRSRTRT
jgi:DNA-binding transcriptional ArsR family regulator